MSDEDTRRLVVEIPKSLHDRLKGYHRTYRSMVVDALRKQYHDPKRLESIRKKIKELEEEEKAEMEDQLKHIKSDAELGH